MDNFSNMFSRLREEASRFLFFEKLLGTVIILVLWFFDSAMLDAPSSVWLIVGLVASVLSTMVYGVAIMGQPFSARVAEIFLVIDMLIIYATVLTARGGVIAAAILSFLAIVSIVFLLEDDRRKFLATVFFSLMIVIPVLHLVSGAIEHLGFEYFILLLFNAVAYVMMLKLAEGIEEITEQVDNLRTERDDLFEKKETLIKEVKLTERRLDYLNKDLKRKSFEIQNIMNVTGQLGDGSDNKELFSSFLLTIVGQVGASHAIYMSGTDAGKNYYTVAEQKGFHDKKIRNLRIYKDSFLIQMLKATREPLLIGQVPRDQLYQDEREILAYFGNDLLNPIIVKNKNIGLFIIGHKLSGDPFTREDMNLITILTNQASFILERSNENTDVFDFYNKTVRALLRSMEVKYTFAKGHALRTAQYVNALARRVGYGSNGQLKSLTYGTILHDIGKIAIRDDILHYDQPINGENRVIKNQILEHTVIGASILKSVSFDDEMVNLALHHHEWFNGRGFPNGLRHEEIPLGVRILSVCNGFDALMSDKPYRKTLGEEWALEQLRADKGERFDPDVVSEFLKELAANPQLRKLNHRA
jgi:putative nucleotidyltransferase with HDIG domain